MGMFLHACKPHCGGKLLEEGFPRGHVEADVCSRDADTLFIKSLFLVSVELPIVTALLWPSIFLTGEVKPD